MLFSATPQSYFENELGKTHYRLIENEGCQLVCILPGFSLPTAIYTSIGFAIAEQGFSVLIMDYFGRGFSVPASEDIEFTPALFAKQLIALLHHLDVDRCDLVAFSFGTLVSSHVSSLEPNLISKLVLVSPFKFLQKPARPFQRLILTNSYIGPFILRQFAAQFIPDEIATQIDAHENPELFWSLVSVTMQEIDNNPHYFRATSSLLKVLDEATIDTELIPLRQNPFMTLVLLGTKDTTIDIVKSEQWWTQQLLNAKVVHIKDAGHLCFIENQKAVFRVITKFLN